MDLEAIVVSNLKELWDECKRRGISQLELSRRSGIAQGQISVWLAGGYKPKLKNLGLLAKAFGLRPADLLEPNAVSKLDPSGISTEIREAVTIGEVIGTEEKHYDSKVSRQKPAHSAKKAK